MQYQPSDHAHCHHGADHSVVHPNVTEPAQPWSADQTLHVAVAYSNPVRWEKRRKLFHDFRRHMESMPNIRLYVGEIAYGDRPFEVTSANHPLDFQFRVQDELWHKENLLNVVIQRFPRNWLYGAYVDADFNFTRHDIALETIQCLQTYDFVQMFSTYSDLTHDHQVHKTLPGFAYALANNLDVQGNAKTQYGRPGSPGGCWAFRRDAFNKVGCLLDTCILGSADWHMACGMAQLHITHPDINQCGSAYRNSILVWQKRSEILMKNIGYVNGHAVHHFHGKKSNRGYNWRWQILKRHDYNPASDIFRDWQGLYQLNPKLWSLRDDIRAYFRSRNEDSID